MGTVHQLIVDRGVAETKRLQDPAIVDIAAAVLGNEREDRGYTYSGLCLTALPHRKIPSEATWERLGHKVRLLIEPGKIQISGQLKTYGVPYGARARMILIYLVTQAVRTNSREIALGRSMRSWLESMSVSYGGETAKAFREQGMRIAACSMRWLWEDEHGRSGIDKGGIVRRGLVFNDSFDAGSDEPRLFDDMVILDELFYASVREHPVPLLEEAVKQLRDRSMSLDIYCWLAYRLYTLKKPTPVSWAALHSQFGGGFREPRFFKRPFIEALRAALAAYPSANLEMDGNGLTLKPSRPPISRLL